LLLLLLLCWVVVRFVVVFVAEENRKVAVEMVIRCGCFERAACWG